MTVVFASNYYNHHMSCFSMEMDRITDHHFFFIEDIPMEQDRKDLGWDFQNLPPFVIRSYEPGGKERCRQLIADADVVIWGTYPFSMILPRLCRGKLTISFSERIFKEGKTGFGYWGRYIKYALMLRAFQKNHYLLCSSGYASGDYARMGLFQGRAYKWGYFPEAIDYDISSVIAHKKPRTLLWVARFLSWKHPEHVVQLAQRLKQSSYSFQLEMVGCGPLEDSIRKMVEENHLSDCVQIPGSVPSAQVRRKMEEASVFLITSDQGEGWGAVLNESMNSGCAVIANRAIGAAPFLIEDGKNGLLYDADDLDALYQKACFLLDHPAEARSLGENAYRTIHEEWNAKNAAEALWNLLRDLSDGKAPSVPSHGPCSIAEILE